MKMIHFDNDYTTGGHNAILQRLIETNSVQTSGYGTDPYCEQARTLIREACDAPLADVHFLVGGTQTNKTVISSILKPYQGVIAADTGHIATNETGAIEATGHKVITVPAQDGKVQAEAVVQLMEGHFATGGNVHQVQPAMVYISHPTEIGTLYTKQELEQLQQVCQQYDIPLFLDGARLGYGLSSPTTDVTLKDIANTCDVFYIGGTKVGAMFGEAVVIMNPSLQKDFRYMMKQSGALLAKGRLLGIQFETLFTDDLYMTISKHAVALALAIREAFLLKGFKSFIDSDTNQQFFIVPNAVLMELRKKYVFAVWQQYDAEHTVIRICTSWSTTTQDVTTLISDVLSLEVAHKVIVQ